MDLVVGPNIHCLVLLHFDLIKYSDQYFMINDENSWHDMNFDMPFPSISNHFRSFGQAAVVPLQEGSLPDQSPRWWSPSSWSHWLRCWHRSPWRFWASQVTQFWNFRTQSLSKSDEVLWLSPSPAKRMEFPMGFQTNGVHFENHRKLTSWTHALQVLLLHYKKQHFDSDASLTASKLRICWHRTSQRIAKWKSGLEPSGSAISNHFLSQSVPLFWVVWVVFQETPAASRKLMIHPCYWFIHEAPPNMIVWAISQRNFGLKSTDFARFPGPKESLCYPLSCWPWALEAPSLRRLDTAHFHWTLGPHGIWPSLPAISDEACCNKH